MAKQHAQPEGEDLDAILGRDQTLTVGGKRVTVRAFRFAEGLRLTPLARPIIDALRDLFVAHEGEPPTESILDLVPQHADAWLALMSESADEPEGWIASMDDTDGMTLLLKFWEVNAPFFATRLMLANRPAPAAPSA